MNIQASTTIILAALSLALASSSGSASSGEGIASFDGITEQVQGLQLSEPQSVDNQSESVQEASSQNFNGQEIKSQDNSDQETNSQDTSGQQVNIQKSKSRDTSGQKVSSQEAIGQEVKSQNVDSQESKNKETKNQNTSSQDSNRWSTTSSSSSDSTSSTLAKTEAEVVPLLKALEGLNLNSKSVDVDSSITEEIVNGENQDDSDSENSGKDPTYAPEEDPKGTLSSSSQTSQSSDENSSSSEKSNEDKAKPRKSDDGSGDSSNDSGENLKNNGSDDESDDESYDGRRREFSTGEDSQDSTESDSAGKTTTQSHPKSSKIGSTFVTKSGTVARWKDSALVPTETASNPQKSKIPMNMQLTEQESTKSRTKGSNDSSSEDSQSSDKNTSSSSSSSEPSFTEELTYNAQQSTLSPKQTHRSNTKDLMRSTLLVAGAMTAICYLYDPEGTASVYQTISAETWEVLVQAQDACTAAGGYLVQQASNLVQTGVESVGAILDAVTPDHDPTICYDWQAPLQQHSTK